MNIINMSVDEKKAELQKCVSTAFRGKDYSGSVEFNDYYSKVGIENITKYQNCIRAWDLLKSRGETNDYNTRQNYDSIFTDALLRFPGYTCEMEKQNGRTF